MPLKLGDALCLQPLSGTGLRGFNMDLGGGRIFGGQLVAQAIVAAGSTCHGFACHSLHGYFLEQGRPGLAMDYCVENIRDGASLLNRRVVARQDDRTIFLLHASFIKIGAGLEYQCDMPKVPVPENLPTLADADDLSAHRQRSSEEMRVDIRPVPLADEASASTEGGPRQKAWWMRMIDPLPDSIILRQAALAYCSDFGLLGTAREVHGLPFRAPGLRIASLDHSLWFHRDFPADDWLLYVMECPTTGQSRGFVRGQLFSRAGNFVASVAQEGIMQLRSRAGK